MKLCVVLPVYNAESYLQECLNSLLTQTFNDFCIIAVNDASTDRSGSILDEYACQDARLKVYHSKINQGDPISTQFALEKAKILGTDYIARMDADDICFPERFEKQISFLEQYPDVDIVGANMLHIDSQSVEIGSPTNVPLSDSLIKTNLMLARCNILNPTAMWRSSATDVPNFRYDVEKTACDYAMWVNLALNRKRFANLKDVLVKYRLHPNQASNKVDLIRESATNIRSWYIMGLFPSLPFSYSIALSLILNTGNVSLDIGTYSAAIQAYDMVRNDNISVLGEDRSAVLAILAEKMTAIRSMLRNYGVEL